MRRMNVKDKISFFIIKQERGGKGSRRWQGGKKQMAKAQEGNLYPKEVMNREGDGEKKKKKV